MTQNKTRPRPSLIKLVATIPTRMIECAANHAQLMPKAPKDGTSRAPNNMTKASVQDCTKKIVRIHPAARAKAR
jgi:hypothetical protein